MPRVLLVEDDRRIADFVRRGLEADGYVVDWAHDGSLGLDYARQGAYPLIILDRILPGMDGLELCRTLRAERCASLILMLTARDALSDKIEGLKQGADDYLTKPFAFDELLARMEALLRRASAEADGKPEVLKVGDLSVSLATKLARRGEREIALTAREFAVLEYLMHHPGTVISRARLLSNIWGFNFDPDTKVLDVCISYLRRKIDVAGQPSLIRTVRGFGYQVGDGRPEGPGQI